METLTLRWAVKDNIYKKYEIEKFEINLKKGQDLLT